MDFLTLIYTLILDMIELIILHNIWVVLLPIIVLIFIKLYEYMKGGL